LFEKIIIEIYRFINDFSDFFKGIYQILTIWEEDLYRAMSLFLYL